MNLISATECIDKNQKGQLPNSKGARYDPGKRPPANREPTEPPRHQRKTFNPGRLIKDDED